MKDVHVVGKKMTRNAGKMAKLIGCAFHFETEFSTQFIHTSFMYELKMKYVSKVNIFGLV